MQQDNNSLSRTFIVIFGARVFADGSPSGALARRVQAACSIGTHRPNTVFLATGAKGREGPAEAEIIRRLLTEANVPEERIILDILSRDTFASIIHCSRILRDILTPTDAVIVCTDRYHVLRCRILFWLCKIPTVSQIIPSGLKQNGLLRWSLYYLRETAAIPVDVALMFVRIFWKRGS